MFHQKKSLLKKVATIKTFGFSPLSKELKAQTDIAKEQYQKLGNTFKFDEIIEKEKLTTENYSKSSLIYSSKYNFYNYRGNSKKFNNLSLKSNCSFLVEIF